MSCSCRPSPVHEGGFSRVEQDRSGRRPIAGGSGWLRRNPSLASTAPLLPNRNGQAMTRSNVNKRLELAVARAAERYPSLNTRHISPHSVRHSTAMHMLQSGVAFSVIALWLGHESMTTTHRYVEADLAMKQNALARLQEPAMESTRYQPPDELMRFLLDL
ncbi:tyrosine-type recombinase/integrase [Thiocapsa bogorovii]|uniref:tyrosine-type recombinase/integrase n=1 Tax=Thiocapsa bogorovii TaxID=521689 RepID=UPI0022B71F91|nr:tyrosine-type recombinase/integrase [Thiocapsa bogorovii]